MRLLLRILCSAKLRTPKPIHNRTQNICAECAALATVPGMVCGRTGGAGLAREVVTADRELYHGDNRRSLLGH